MGNVPFRLAILGWLIFSLWSPPSSAQSGQATVIDRIVAVVNDDVILQTELDDGMRMLKARLAEQKAPMPPDDVLQSRLLQKLILDQIQLQLAERNGIRVDDEMLNKAIRRIAEDNHLTLTQLRQVVEADGFSFAKFREDLRKEIVITQLRKQQVTNHVTVTDQEVDAFLASQGGAGGKEGEYHLRHILIALPETPSPDDIQSARRKAEQVVASVRGGRDFAEAAIEFSDAPDALEGGDLGWRSPGQIPSLFADRAAKMQPGEVSDPIQSPSGFHIIQLVEVHGSQRHVVRQIRARHILVVTNEMVSDAEAQERLGQLRQRLLAGEDFGALARAHSDDKASALKGGDLGWVGPGDMVPEFEEVMDRLSPGEISEPFRTEFGWHIVQVQDRRERDSTTEFQRSQAREQLRRRKVEEETALWLRRMRDESYVETRL